MDTKMFLMSVLLNCNAIERVRSGESGTQYLQVVNQGEVPKTRLEIFPGFLKLQEIKMELSIKDTIEVIESIFIREDARKYAEWLSQRIEQKKHRW